VGNGLDASPYSVRSLSSDDVEIFSALRTEAIINHPDAFLDTPEKARQRSKSEWLAYFEGSHKQIFGLFFEDMLIGLGSVFQDKDDDQIGLFAMGYIQQARIDWCKRETDFTKIVIYHRKGNIASRRAMLKAGFIYVQDEYETFGDGQTCINLKYELDLTL
jgi:hypothetical protein